nr:hypothetical protein [Pseudomonas aeruginosa]
MFKKTCQLFGRLSELDQMMSPGLVQPPSIIARALQDNVNRMDRTGRWGSAVLQIEA